MTLAMQSQYHSSNHEGNFEFLKPEFSELYLQAVQAEKYLYTDSQSSLSKMRLFVEMACHELGKYFSLIPPVHGDLRNKIHMLSASGCVDAWVIDAMHRLREEGNRSVHLTEVNGNYVAQLNISRQRMKSMMQDVHEIAKFIVCKMKDISLSEVGDWIEPEQSQLAEQVYAALNGDRYSSFTLAEHFYQQLEEMKETGNEKWWNKTIYADRQRDLAYWLEKAHAQGHPSSWFLLAKSYASKKLMPDQGRDAKTCFKQAIKDDSDGEPTFYYGLYLQTQQQHNLGWEMIAEAANKGYHQALGWMQEKSYSSDLSTYQTWLDLGLKCNQLTAFTMDAHQKLERYEADVDNEVYLKQLRSAVITGTAKRAPGISYVSAYIDGIGMGNKSISKEDMAEKMVTAAQALPSFLPYQARLFRVVSEVGGQYSVMRKIYSRALAQTDDAAGKAHVKYVMAKTAIDEFKVTKTVKTPDSIHNMLQEAADEGHQEARAYLNSSEGKALLKRTGFTTAGRMQPKSSKEKAKDKKKRKVARKAKRK